MLDTAKLFRRLRHPLRTYGNAIQEALEILDALAIKRARRRHDRMVSADRKALLAAIAPDSGPLFSFVIPVYNPDLANFDATIASIKEQIRGRWEICIADDASTDAGVKPYLEALSAADHRIHVCFRDRNGHISACSNSAASLAQGEWLVLVDQEDLVAPEALAYMLREIGAAPQAELIFSDEDKIDAANQLLEPYFKTDFDPELILGHNMVSHLAAYRRDRFLALGGFRSAFDGSQDYDLALRFFLAARARSNVTAAIRHIPAILYHWRIMPGSASASPLAKPYARAAAQRAVAAAMAEIAPQATVSPVAVANPGQSVRYPPASPTSIALVSIGAPLAAAQIAGWRQSLASQGDVAEIWQARVSPKQKTGQTLAEIIATSRQELLLLVAATAWPMAPDALERLLAASAQDGFGGAGGRVIDHNGRLLGAPWLLRGNSAYMPGHGRSRNYRGHQNLLLLRRHVEALGPGCFILPRRIAAQMPQNMPAAALPWLLLYCQRARHAGLTITYIPEALLHVAQTARRFLPSTQSLPNDLVLPEQAGRYWSRYLSVRG